MLYDHLSSNSAGHLTIAGQDTVELAARYGTPLMVVDEALVRRRCRIYKQEMSESFPAGSMPLYASKARFSSSLASTSRWLVGSSRISRLVGRLISLQSRTLACSPPLSTFTRL